MFEKQHEADLCIVGGGLAGIAAAIAAARHGIKVVLMHDRPVLGGNASSEVRMWVCGAHGKNNRETGIIEEILLENLYRNHQQVYSIWDSILYEKVRFEPNITLLLNCSCTDLKMEGSRIRSVRGWQLTTYTWHTVKASLFADCSGDSVLAPLSGADFRMGREAQGEFSETIAPQDADNMTMGMSCLIQARETDQKQPYTPPSWANVYPTDADLPFRSHNIHSANTNFWWIELGGEQHSTRDTEEVRDELVKVAFGVWDHIKNQADHEADNWLLDWVGFLPGKRESRRYIGDHILTQHDVEAEGRFDDIVAFGGWTMDDHHPGGMRWKGKPNIHHPAPSPFGIPYRCLYSRNIDNLYFAGRNISTTHAALSSTRVMATTALLGQAVGTAAAIAVHKALSPRGVLHNAIDLLQQALMEDDCYLPWHTRRIAQLSREAHLAASSGNPEPLRNGQDRPIGENDNGWTGAVGDWVEFRFAQPQTVRAARFTFDSDINRSGKNMPASYPLHRPPEQVPKTVVRDFRLLAEHENGAWREVTQITENHQRLLRVPLNVTTTAIRFVADRTWGSNAVHLFSFDVM